jgi:DNA end-binding protein Ku
MEALALPPDGVKAAGLRDAELKMAEQLVDDMAAKFEPGDYQDEFKDQILQLVAAKAKAGKLKAVTQLEAPDEGTGGADILDLTALLQRSLKRQPTSIEDKPAAKKSTATKKVAPAAKKRRAA